MEFITRGNAKNFLFINAFLWGSSYVWSKMLLGYLPRFSILTISALGGLITTIMLFRSHLRTIDRKTLLTGIFISSFSIISNIFFMFALQYTSSSNAAFIVQLSVVITPGIVGLVEKRMPEGKAIMGGVVALSGLLILTCDFSNFTLNTGDLLALGNAVFFSLFLASQKINSSKLNPVHFTLIHHGVNTAAFLILAATLETGHIEFNKLKAPVFLILAAASTFICIVTVLLQSTALKFVTVEKATIIYTLEPVTALVLGFGFLKEKPDGIKTVIGCSLILLSVFYSIYSPKFVKATSRSKPAL